MQARATSAGVPDVGAARDPLGETRLGQLVAEQAALRRVATLVAGDQPPEAVFAAVAAEVGQLLAVDFAILVRYDSQVSLEVVGAWTKTGSPAPTPVGDHLPLGGRNVTTRVFSTGRSARIDYDDEISGVIGQVASRDWGLHSSAGVPLRAERRLWGCMVVALNRQGLLPADTEARLESFAELVVTAIANAENRAALARLAEEQAALRRVATTVAHGAAPEEVFEAVTKELPRLIPVDVAAMTRLEPDGTVVYVASWGKGVDLTPVGSRWTLDGNNIATDLLATGHPIRVDSQAGATGSMADLIREIGLHSLVVTPVVVEDQLWGGIGAGSTMEQPLPADTEARLASFTELVAMAIANVESRSELKASRARVVAAADESRRRIERDLHDGIQQQLVTVLLDLRRLQAEVPRHLVELEGELSRIAERVASARDQVQEISRGIHPAILSKGGLHVALKALARRSAVPVELDLLTVQRLSESAEVAAYYAVSEALTNVVKHARASVVHVVVDAPDAVVRLEISDDGIGGADPAKGSGLTGLRDRVEALGGRFDVHSSGSDGTTLLIEMPA